MPNVTFITAAGDRIEAFAAAGDTITQVAYRAGVSILQSCGGTPSCADCVVKVLSESHPQALDPMEHAEVALLGNVYFITKERLACQAVVRNDVTLEVPKPKEKIADSAKRGKRK